MDHFGSLSTIAKSYVRGRTESAGLLLWFLEHVFRLDQTEAEDAICDGISDFGIDALVVVDEEQFIYVFQSKFRERSDRELGTSSLTSFVGALEHLKSPARVQARPESSTNSNLRSLLVEGQVASKVETYQVRPIFVTNARANKDATDYVTTVAKDGGTQID